MISREQKLIEEAIKHLEDVKENIKPISNSFDLLTESSIETVIKELERLQEDYIPKDKIREKIEQLNENRDMISGGYAISILEELLEGK